MAAHRIHRRELALLALGWLVAGPRTAAAQAGADEAALVERLRAGRCALMLRHAQTEPGVGDPPGFVPGQCATQRNLSEAGRSQARAIGRWLQARALQPSAVPCSAWCRCIDTAVLAVGRQTHWAPLDSGFGRGEAAAQARPRLLERLMAIEAGRFELWVTHQVNVTAFTGEMVAMGEAVLLDAGGRVVGRSAFGAG